MLNLTIIIWSAEGLTPSITFRVDTVMKNYIPFA